MSKHTKEPWKLWNNPNYKTFYGACPEKMEEPNNESFIFDRAFHLDAKRIVATVNFCEGFPNEDLAKMGSLKDVRKLLKEVYDHGENFNLHDRIGEALQSITPPKDRT